MYKMKKSKIKIDKKGDKSKKSNLDADDKLEEKIRPGLHKKVQKLENKKNSGKFKKLTHKEEHKLEERVSPGVHKRMKKIDKAEKKEKKESKKPKMFIAAAIKKPGALRAELHVKKGHKIPKEKLEKASHAKGKEGKRARLAITLRALSHHRKKK